MAYYAEPKMDWNELVKKTTTGITSAREYQLLWRHLAYRNPLLPVEDGAQLPVCLISFQSQFRYIALVLRFSMGFDFSDVH